MDRSELVFVFLGFLGSSSRPVLGSAIMRVCVCFYLCCTLRDAALCRPFWVCVLVGLRLSLFFCPSLCRGKVLCVAAVLWAFPEFRPAFC